MPISTADLLNFAAELAADGRTETEVRASMSRAYYVAFHALLPVVKLLPASRTTVKVSTNPDLSHKELSERLREWRAPDPNPTGKAVAAIAFRLLDRTRLIRVRADYRLDDEVNAREAREQVERARALARHASSLSQYCQPQAAEQQSA
jgi:uncharacterized protein (UPF0332 family)